MKTIIAFFVTIYNWFISLFKREEKKTLSEPHSEAKKTVTFSNNPITAAHNNRKPTKGRHVQYVNMGPNGVSRAIYHGAK